MQKKLWSASDIIYLKKHFEKETVANLEKFLQRSWSSIKSKAYDLHLKRGDEYFWSEEDTQILKQNYAKTTTTQMLSLLPNKNKGTIRAKAECLGLKKDVNSFEGSKPWTDSEIIILKENYKDMSLERLLRLLPNRKARAIQIQASRLNLDRNTEIKNRTREETNILKFGTPYLTKSAEIKEKIKQNNLKKYGKESFTQTEEYKLAQEQRNLEKWGVKTNLCLEETKERIKNTNILKYGVPNPSQNEQIKIKRELTNIRIYGVPHVLSLPGIREKIRNTYLKKFGVTHNMHIPEVVEKIRLKKLQNNSFGKSRPEDLLATFFQDVSFLECGSTLERQYSEDRYPFSCDFYVKEWDCFIEFQGYWSHGDEPYSCQELSIWEDKAKNSDHYKNAINVYTNKDPEKREFAYKNNLNYLEIWKSDFELGWEWIDFLFMKQGLPLSYSEKTLQQEYDNINKSSGDFSAPPRHNRIVEHYQPSFYKVERGLWNNPHIRIKLVENREKYLFKKKEEITIKQFLQGFKISGIHRSFSFFSPLWIKAFIEKYKISSIYDPCMGWGHRLLGARDILYIGNDCDPETVKGNEAISSFFNMTHKVFYNNLAESFVPPEKYEAVFTCPPYFNIEKYLASNTSTEKYPEYSNWLNIWWRSLIKCATQNKPKYFAFVINNKFKGDMLNICLQENLEFIEEIPVGNNILDHFQKNKSTQKGEFLLVFLV